MSHSDTVTHENVALDIHGNKEILSIHSAEDVAKLLKERTNLSYDITVHKQDKTDEIKNSVETNIVVKKKNLPSDAFYKAVLIRQSRRKSTVNDANDDSDYDDIVDSDD